MFSLLLALAAPEIAPRIPTVAERADISRAVGDLLLDGESARFRWPKMVRDVGYCGFVNAKNSFGAYTGFKPFFVLGAVKDGPGYEVTEILLSTEEGRDAGIAEKMCVNAGYDPLVLPSG